MTNLLRLDTIARGDPQTSRLRRGYKRKTQYISALLGKGDGNDPYYGAGNNRIWIRRDGGYTDPDGNISPMSPEKVYCGSNSYHVFDGLRCWLETDPNGEWQVAQIDNQYADSVTDLHTGQLNLGNPSNKWMRLKNVTRLKCLPVGTADNASTLVGVRGNTFIDNYGDFNRFTATGLASTKLDLASYIPGSDLHAVVVVWLDTVNGVLVATSSTAQANTTDLDETDYQEAYDSQPAEAIPIQAFHLGDAQTSIDLRHLGQDLRTFINTPQATGFPNPVDKDTIIRAGRVERVCDDLSVTSTLTVAGELTCETVTVTGDLIVTGDVIIRSCDIGDIEDDIVTLTPGLVEIDYTQSPYTAPTDRIDTTIIVDTSGGDVTIALPPIASNKNQRYNIKNIGTGTITIDGNGSETIDGAVTLTVVVQYDAPRIVCTSQEWSII